MAPPSVERHLEALGTENLLDVRITDAVRYTLQPARPELMRLVEATARAHYERRDLVLALLTRRPVGVQLFADAFDLRREKK